jgi:hypothetical protein
VKRVSVEEVKAAYAATGMRPYRGSYCSSLDGQLCGCGLGAVFFKEKHYSPGGTCDVHKALKLDYEYIGGFVGGFDGDSPEECEGGEYELAGYADGKAAAEAVFGGDG